MYVSFNSKAFLKLILYISRKYILKYMKYIYLHFSPLFPLLRICPHLKILALEPHLLFGWSKLLVLRWVLGSILSKFLNILWKYIFLSQSSDNILVEHRILKWSHWSFDDIPLPSKRSKRGLLFEGGEICFF